MASETEPAPRPNLGNAIVGIAGIGARAAAAGTAAAVTVTGAALRPGAAVARAVIGSPPGELAQDRIMPRYEALDAAGRRDLERARARLNRTLDETIDGAIERLLASPRSKRAVERILESDELWLLVERIANSAEVLDAITSTSMGLAGEVAGEARRRTVTADDVAERIARRLLGRGPRVAESPAGDLDAADHAALQP